MIFWLEAPILPKRHTLESSVVRFMAVCDEGCRYLRQFVTRTTPRAPLTKRPNDDNAYASLMFLLGPFNHKPNVFQMAWGVPGPH